MITILILAAMFLQPPVTLQLPAASDDPNVAIVLARKNCAEDRNYPGTCTDATVLKLSDARKQYEELLATGTKTGLTDDEEQLYAALARSIGEIEAIREHDRQAQANEAEIRDYLRNQQESMRTYFCRVGHAAWCQRGS